MTDPHAVVFRRACPVCGFEGLDIVTIPKLSTGEYFPQFAACDACGTKINFLERPPAMRISDVEQAIAEEQRPTEPVHYSWTQPLCGECWPEFINEPGREPIRSVDGPTERCCHCGTITNAGIYARIDPSGTFCAYPTNVKG